MGVDYGAASMRRVRDDSSDDRREAMEAMGEKKWNRYQCYCRSMRREKWTRSGVGSVNKLEVFDVESLLAFQSRNENSSLKFKYDSETSDAVPVRMST
jgi:hypothetical protein